MKKQHFALSLLVILFAFNAKAKAIDCEKSFRLGILQLKMASFETKNAALFAEDKKYKKAISFYFKAIKNLNISKNILSKVSSNQRCIVQSFEAQENIDLVDHIKNKIKCRIKVEQSNDTFLNYKKENSNKNLKKYIYSLVKIAKSPTCGIDIKDKALTLIKKKR